VYIENKHARKILKVDTLICLIKRFRFDVDDRESKDKKKKNKKDEEEEEEEE
jgi:hypothetical protein